MRKWGRSESFPGWAKFYAEWNNYSNAIHNGFFLSPSQKGVCFGSQSVNTRALPKELIATTGFFQQIFQFS